MKWKKTAETLPKDGERVLVVHNDEILILRWNHHLLLWHESNFDSCKMEKIVCQKDEIIHWQPLPKQPK